MPINQISISVIQLFLSILLAACGGVSSDSSAEDLTTETVETRREGRFDLKLIVHGAPNDVAKILGSYGNQNFLIDSAKSDANGLFLFEADSLLPTGFYYVMLSSDNSYFQLLLDADQEFELETTKGDFINTMKVSGCIDNELLYKNLQFEADFNGRLTPVSNMLTNSAEGSAEHSRLKVEQEKLIKERKAHVQWFADNHPNSFFTKFKLSGQNPELTYPKKADGSLDQELQLYVYRKQFWDMIDFKSTSSIRTPVFANKLRKYIRELTPQNADSLIKYSDEIIQLSKANKEIFKFVVNWIALEYKTPKTMGTEALYVHLIDKYWTEDQAFWSNPEEIKGLHGEVSLMKPSLIGKVGQDIKASNERGETISLHGLKSPIKVLFIYSYDCEHCQKESPEMVRVYNQWNDKGVDVFSLCTDTDQAKWLAFVKKNNMNFHNVFDPKRTSGYERKYHIDITPELYVLDKNNRIIASNLSPNQLPEFLETHRAKHPW